jgi:hypothetical protein
MHLTLLMRPGGIKSDPTIAINDSTRSVSRGDSLLPASSFHRMGNFEMSLVALLISSIFFMSLEFDNSLQLLANSTLLIPSHSISQNLRELDRRIAMGLLPHSTMCVLSMEILKI